MAETSVVVNLILINIDTERGWVKISLVLKDWIIMSVSLHGTCSSLPCISFQTHDGLFFLFFFMQQKLTKEEEDLLKQLTELRLAKTLFLSSPKKIALMATDDLELN